MANLETERALAFAASLETTVKRMLAYAQCCCETAEVLSGLLISATLTAAMREKLSRLRDGQKVISREMVSAVTRANEAMEQRQAGMLEIETTEAPETPAAFR